MEKGGRMVGIMSYGAHIPVHRLSRVEIGRAWGKYAVFGEKAVAYYDEDSLTMAVAAAMNCTAGIDPKSIGGLYFASTTSPYREKQAAGTIATVLDISKEAFTVDICNSLRAGTGAVRIAMDAINSDSADNILVSAADCRLGIPNSDAEMSFGDGAAALLIGKTGVIATIEGVYGVSNELLDVWRSDKDAFVHSWESRFVRDEGYTKIVTEVVSAAMKKFNLMPKDLAKVVLYAPDSRQLELVARKLGFDLMTQVQDTLYSMIGNTGTAQPLMTLAAALEDAKAGDRILLASYGDGCEVFILKVTKEIEKFRSKWGVKAQLAAKLMISTYEKYLRWHEFIEVEPPATAPMEQPSPVALWRDTHGLTLHGVKCKRCGTIQYPVQRVCMNCRAKDEFDDYRFTDKVGKLVTFSHDNMGNVIDPPNTVAVVDFPEGGRITCDMTDRDPDQVKVGMSVLMTFRKIRYVGGFYDYWWKCCPMRE